MFRHRGFTLSLKFGVVCAVLACSTNAHAELLGYWSANSPNDDFEVKNDFGNEDYVAVFEGDANFAGDKMGHTGEAGDNAMEFFGTDEDFAAVEIPEITYEEITIAGWLKGAQTGAWSGIFGSRDDPPIGIGYNGSSGRLTYTWNDNNANSWDFPANTPDGDDLIIPEDEWTFVALSLSPNSATLFSGPKGGELLGVTNDIPQLTQAPAGTGWRFGEDNCCGAERNFIGLMDDFAIWNHALLPEELAEIHAGDKIPTDFPDASGRPPSPVGGAGEIGSNVLSAERGNQVFSAPEGDPVPGLGQSWYAVANPGSKSGIDAIAQSNDRAVPYFHGEDGTWWTGSNDIVDIQKYPIEVDGVITGDNYTVVLDGEILIEESGPIQFLDGVDDFTYLAIDMDRSGTPGDIDEEILINDNSWTDALSVGNGGAPIVEADFEDIAAGGEWLAMEFAMAEGGGGDHGMLYWDAMDEDGFFPAAQGEGVLDVDAVVFQIPDTHLRGPESPPTLLSGDATGAVPGRDAGWEIDVNAADGTSDTFVLENPDEDIYSTILDVDGLIVHVNAIGDVSDGDSFQVFVADTVTGMPTIATEGWNFDAATGSLVFGALSACNPNTQGDLDGNGAVEFADFLAMSANFGNAVGSHTEGDIDCNGTVEFADFLVLSNNFGSVVGAETSNVPEPTGLALLSIAGLLGGLLRRRRN